MRAELNGVGVRFSTTWLFRDLNAVWSAPSMVSLTGPSGSGKTTLLGVIAGTIRPTAGQCRVENAGSGVSTAGWVVQNSPLLVARTALENVVLGPLSQGYRLDQATMYAQQQMERLNISHLATVRAKKLSGGERQRVTVARALASRSRLILADEPTSSLDPASKHLITSALKAATHENGALVVMATHDLEVAHQADISLHLGDAI
jgi:ABC-type lipoprotein export system ATPase subunit